MSPPFSEPLAQRPDRNIKRRSDGTQDCDERGEATLNEAAEQLSVSPSTIRRMINAGTLPASQLFKGAPWIIRHADLSHERVRREADRRRERRPVSTDRLQTSFDL